MAIQGLGGDAEFGRAVQQPVGNLLRTALLDVQAYRGMRPTKRCTTSVACNAPGYGWWPGSAAAAGFGGEIGTDPAHVRGLAQHPTRLVQHQPARRRDLPRRLPPLEDRNPKLLLEQAICLEMPGCEVNSAAAAARRC
jgi:hypothetical protein